LASINGHRKALLWSAIPPLATAAFIALFGSNVPFWDEWDLATLLEKLARHTATLGDFFQPQSEHRFVLPKLILAPLALQTHWNVTAELWLSFAVAVIGYVGLVILVRGSNGGRLFITSLAYFSLAACENWLWGWQFSWFLANTLFIWAVVAAASIRNRPLQIASAALLCFLATFSAAYGVASWVALAPFLWRPINNDETRVRRVAALAVWAAFFSASLGLYVFRYDTTPGGSSCGEISCWIAYVLAIAGSPVARVNALAVAAGAILLTCFAALALGAWRRSEREALPWIPIGLFAIGFAVINAVGRSGLGLSQALTSRYLTPTSLLLIAAINLDSKPHRFRRAIRVAVAAALIMQSLSSIPFGWQIKHARDESRVCLELLLLNDSADCTAPLAASNAELRSRAAAIHQIGLRQLVSPSDFAATPQARGSIDAVTRISRTPNPAIGVRGTIELPSRGLYAIVATPAGTRRIVAADLVRGDGTLDWTLVLPAHIVQRNGAFEVWLFLPAERKLYRLEQRLLRPDARR
jgi:hypothetical protein